MGPKAGNPEGDKYTLDTSFFIGAWYRMYPKHNFPGFWDSLNELIDAGRAMAVEEVVTEIKKQEDDLAAWVTARKKGLSSASGNTKSLLQDAATIASTFHDLTKKNSDAADPYVIAHAKRHGYIVITDERTARSRNEKARIPLVCQEMKLKCESPVHIVTAEDWRFVCDPDLG